MLSFDNFYGYFEWDKAKANAGELDATLLPCAERGMAIIGLEPSCLLTMRDEMRVMGLGDATQSIRRQARSARSSMCSS